MRRRLAGCRAAVVAVGAARRDAGVVHPRAGERDGALVAGLAGRRRDDVRRRLAGGGRAVVAAGAARRDAGVVHAAPANETVLLWQVSQAAVVTTCVGGLPVAVRAVVAVGAAR